MTNDGANRNSTQIRLGGVGGQGIVLGGRLLGKAAALFDDKEAVVTQSYGPEARGGASRTDVIISNACFQWIPDHECDEQDRGHRNY